MFEDDVDAAVVVLYWHSVKNAFKVRCHDGVKTIVLFLEINGIKDEQGIGRPRVTGWETSECPKCLSSLSFQIAELIGGHHPSPLTAMSACRLHGTGLL
ncbi:hypothetical protein IFR09_11660 [Pseudomonas syringae]|nr:hypothetical protein [Pseudomonas syringae]MBD8801835.1 hypothetical protein [Pseudomonas syringae]MBD8811815.1 hypothetical protein [Pseudomonas syringae]